MAIKTQVVTLKITYDTDQHDEPANWSWSGIIDGEAELLDYEPPEPTTEQSP